MKTRMKYVHKIQEKLMMLRKTCENVSGGSFGKIFQLTFNSKVTEEIT